MELGNLIRVTYGANVITNAYSRTDDTNSSITEEDAQVTIQYLLHGEKAEINQNQSYANEAISMTQGFAAQAANIKEKLEQMEELAEQAASGQYSGEEIAEMQEEFERLAEDINDIAASAGYNGNKLFSSEGTNISISIGNGSSIDIAAKDMSIDVESLDLTTDPESALSVIQSKVRHAEYYSGYLDDQVDRLGNATQLIEFERYNDMGIEAEEFDMDLAKEVAGAASTKTYGEFVQLFAAQSNVDPDKVWELLQDRVEEALWQEDTE